MVFIRDLAVVLGTAGAVAWACHRLGLSVVVGYLVAGMMIGPFTPPFAFVSDLERVETLAQLGLVFLIFSIGLNLSLGRLQRLGWSLVVAAGLAAVGVLLGVRLCGSALGWSAAEGLFLAGMLMVSSSAIISKVLEEANLTHERSGQMALGVTVLEDVVAVLMLTLLTSLTQWGGAGAEAEAGGVASWLGTLGALGAFVVFLALMSLMLVPRLLARLGGGMPVEVRTLVVGGLLLGVGWLAVQLGYSLALGAFVLGAIVGGTRFKADVAEAFDGLRQIFGAVFFVAVGMQVDPRLLIDGAAWPWVLGVTVLALVLRPLACWLSFLATGQDRREALVAALTLTPLGEFSFIIAQLGVDSGMVPSVFFPVAVGASLLTSLAAPAMTRRAEGIADAWMAREPVWLREWVGFYHDWLRRLGRKQGASVVWKLTGGRLVQVGIWMLFLSAVILLVRPAYGAARTALGFAEATYPWWLTLVFALGLGVVLLAPLMALGRNVSALAMIFAEAATQGSARQRRLRPLLETLFRTVAMAVLGLWLLALLPAGALLLGGVGVAVVILVTVGVVFRRRLIRMHSRLEIELRDEFRRASHAASSSAWMPSLMSPTPDWGVELDEVVLPRESVFAGRTLGDLAMRRRLGCSVVGIDRQGFALVNPKADTRLFPRDKLLLMGTREQLTLATKELGSSVVQTGGPAGFDELTMETVKVPMGSVMAGQSLAALDMIRKYEVQLGGLRRRGQVQFAPSGQAQFEEGDELLVLGTVERLRAFEVAMNQVREGMEP
jgi:CPA2 family monovalent cation:H+ antiporter-2